MSNCCEKCFADEYLIKYIQDVNVIDDCDFCGSQKVHVIASEDLEDLFNPLMSLYSAQVEFMPLDELKRCEGRMIWQVLSEDWDVFDDWEVGQQIIEDIYSAVPPGEETPLFLDNFVEREDEYWGHDRDFSDKLIQRWKDFADEIMHHNRFFPKNFLENELLLELLVFLESNISKDSLFFRSRIGKNNQKLDIGEMGPPPKGKPPSGRANPLGISYLYVASDVNTAISEVRPQVGDCVSVAQYKIKENMRVIDLRNPLIGSPFKWGHNLNYILESIAFLRMLGAELSRPVDCNRTSLNYLPTQYLCEFIKQNDFEGVLYKSYRADGYNLVLFEVGQVEPVEVKYFNVNRIHINFEEAQNSDNEITI